MSNLAIKIDPVEEIFGDRYIDLRYNIRIEGGTDGQEDESPNF